MAESKSDAQESKERELPGIAAIQSVLWYSRTRSTIVSVVCIFSCCGLIEHKTSKSRRLQSTGPHHTSIVRLSEGSDAPSQVGGHTRVAGIATLFLCGNRADEGRVEGERIIKRDG